MTAADFCVWLKRFLSRREGSLTGGEIVAIRRRMEDVFIHEIDPGMGDAAHQSALNKIHGGIDTRPCAERKLRADYL